MTCISFLFFLVCMGCMVVEVPDMTWWGVLLRVVVMLVSGFCMVITHPETGRKKQ